MTAVKKIIAKTIAMVLMAACITVLFVSMALARRDQVIYPSNVAVGSISIANLNREEARARLQADMGSKWGNTLQLKIDKSTAIYSIPLSELKINYNIDSSLKKTDQHINQPSQLGSLINHTLVRGKKVNVNPVLDIKDRSLIYSKLVDIKEKLDIPATNARVKYDQGYLEYIEHKDGMAVDLDASLKMIETALDKGSLEPINLVTKKLYPQVRIEDIKSITDLIGVSMISMPSGQNTDMLTRIQASLNGTIVMPGDQFSWQAAVEKKLSQAEISQPNYQQTLPEITDLMVKACRSAHLNTICTESGKLSFSNNLGKPIMLSLVIEGNDLAVKIFGCQTETGKEISLIKEQTVISPEVEVQVDNNLKAGERNVIAGHEGKIVRTYRVVKINGVKTDKKLLSEEVFPASNTIMKVPPGTVIK